MTKRTAPPTTTLDPKTNVFLGKLNPEDYAAVMAKAKVVEMKFHKTLFRQDQAIDAVFFPLNCMVSLLVTSDSKLELAAVGKEGVVGAVVPVVWRIRYTVPARNGVSPNHTRRALTRRATTGMREGSTSISPRPTST